MNDNGNVMGDAQALINALARACMDRERTEAVAQSLLAENAQLKARIAELTKTPATVAEEKER